MEYYAGLCSMLFQAATKSNHFKELHTYYFCKANLPRGLDANILAEKAFIAGLRGNVYESVQNAYRSALNNANFNDVVFVGGSNFTVAEII